MSAISRRFRAFTTTSFASLTALLLPAVALAHPGHGHSGYGLGTGLGSGLLHPLTGIDHLLAMLAVGIWAAQLGGRARWMVPAAFVVLMIGGGSLGMAGLALPAVETAIAVSVLTLGVCVTATARLPLAAALALVGVFAVFHGYAHGVEMPAHTGASGYLAGFTLTTVLLHGAGVAFGSVGTRTRPWLLRVAGVAIAISGAALLA